MQYNLKQHHTTIGEASDKTAARLNKMESRSLTTPNYTASINRSTNEVQENIECYQISIKVFECLLVGKILFKRQIG